MSDFIEKMVALANVVHSDLVVLPDDRARYDLVKQIIDSAEMVFAVWTDRFAQDGVGHMLVKGQGIARQAVADNKMALSTRVWQPSPATTQIRLRRCCTSLGNGIAGTDLFGGGSTGAGLSAGRGEDAQRVEGDVKLGRHAALTGLSRKGASSRHQPCERHHDRQFAMAT